jgi:hypothetical protein
MLLQYKIDEFEVLDKELLLFVLIMMKKQKLLFSDQKE